MMGCKGTRVTIVLSVAEREALLYRLEVSRPGRALTTADTAALLAAIKKLCGARAAAWGRKTH